MMRVLAVLAHPNKSSLNHAIADRALLALHRNGHEVIFHDLYAEHFDPVLPGSEIEYDADPDPKIRAYSDELSAADGIVIVHPNWWGGMPAILKGWVDRVFRQGCVYKFEEVEGGVGIPVGLLKANKVLILNTENTPKDMSDQMGDTLDNLWRNRIFGLCGARDVRHRMFHGVIMADRALCDSWLAEVEDHINDLFPAQTARLAA